MSRKLLALHGLKYNPFSSEIPPEAIKVTPRIESFCWRVEQLVGEGGFALVTGDPGTGKSVTLRLLAERLSALRDVTVGVLTRPQAGIPDFYREMGDLFGVTLTPHNRWGGTKGLRQKWLAHIETSLYRPVLLVDEAQEMHPAVLSELRLLSAMGLDSRQILTLVLAGDDRLAAKLDSPELLPVKSRIRTRLRTEPAAPEELAECIKHLLTEAGSARLMTAELVNTLAEHAAGNYRTLVNLANDLLVAAVEREAERIDEKLFFEVFDLVGAAAPRPGSGQAGKGRKR